MNGGGVRDTPAVDRTRRVYAGANCQRRSLVPAVVKRDVEDVLRGVVRTRNRAGNQVTGFAGIRGDLRFLILDRRLRSAHMNVRPDGVRTLRARRRRGALRAHGSCKCR
jgi:hypothetical protein